VAGESDPRVYRNDVDGLRALAVLLVVLYHLRVPGFAGGFVGVDVFFVISGFVVTRVIAPRIAAGEFSLLGFYKNRFWRLQPAFFLVLAATLVAIGLLFAPTDLLRTSQSGLFASLFSANFYFWKTTSSYASDLAEQEPLLHMWSLAVEEQFYLLWPSLLMLGSRVRWLRRPVILAIILLASLALSEWLARAHPSFAYFLLPARIVELGLGAALVATEPTKLARGVALGASALGIALIAGSAVGLSTAVTFPGVIALLPCGGAALLIQAGSTKTALSAALEHPVAQYVGRVSYAWYLWHWPPIALANYLLIPLTPLLALGLALGSLAMASASYHLWETPTRRAPAPAYRYATFALGLGTLAAVVALVSLPPPDVARAKRDEDAAVKDQVALDRACLLVATGWTEIDKCAGRKKPRKGKRLLIWGDSHSGVYERSVRAIGKELGWATTTLTYNGCPPIVGVHRVDDDRRAEWCTEEESEKVIRFIERNRFDAILLTARFGMYERGWHVNGKLVGHRTHFLADARTRGKNAKESRAALRRGLLRTARRLEDQRLVFALPTPEMPNAPKKDRTRTLGIDRAAYLEQRRFIEGVSADLPGGVAVFDPIDAVCDAERCPGWVGDQPLYNDDNHLSETGRNRLAPLLRAQLDALALGKHL
jgi:peptidoglycan/LPS O-acetylase OafA/YrhL